MHRESILIAACLLGGGKWGAFRTIGRIGCTAHTVSTSARQLAPSKRNAPEQFWRLRLDRNRRGKARTMYLGQDRHGAKTALCIIPWVASVRFASKLKDTHRKGARPSPLARPFLLDEWHAGQASVQAGARTKALKLRTSVRRSARRLCSSSACSKRAHFLLVQMTHRGRINLATEVNKWNKMQ